MSKSIQMTPAFKSMTIGIRDPKVRKIYPLSWADTRKIQNLIYQCFVQVAELEIKDPAVVYNFLFQTIYENLMVIANLVIEGDEVSGEDLSAAQATELVNIIYDMNFETIVKNLESLLQKTKSLMEKAETKA